MISALKLIVACKIFSWLRLSTNYMSSEERAHGKMVSRCYIAK